MGIDPFDMRERNCYKASEHTTIPTGYAPDVYCEEDLFKTARPLYEAAKKRVAEKNAKSDGKVKYGVGVSLGVYGCGLDGVDSSQADAELMEAEGKNDPELTRAVGGLNEGVGYSGDLCGCLTGGCCLLSYFLGKGEAEELEDPEYRATLADFAQWFRDKTEGEYGSAKCAGITGGDVGKRLEYCPGLMADTYEKCMGMAYSKAWRIIKATEKEFGVKLVERDGVHGSSLTPQARELTETYRELLEKAQSAADATLTK